jgi:hypothetical protein
LQAPCIPMWSSWFGLGARSPASEWVQRPEMHAHHPPGAWPSPTSIWDLRRSGSSAFPSLSSLSSWVSFASLETPRPYQRPRLAPTAAEWCVGIPRAWKVIPIDELPGRGLSSVEVTCAGIAFDRSWAFLSPSDLFSFTHLPLRFSVYNFGHDGRQVASVRLAISRSLQPLCRTRVNVRLPANSWEQDFFTVLYQRSFGR